MAARQLAIIDSDSKDLFRYSKDTVRIHSVAKSFLHSKQNAYHLKMFSLLDDSGVKCSPRIIYEGAAGYFFEILFITPVPQGSQYEISLYYFNKFDKLTHAGVRYPRTVQENTKIKMPCDSIFLTENKSYVNEIDGCFILCSKISRKDISFLLQQKPALLLPTQITNCSLLFDNKVLSDLTIIVGNTEFHVHREILAAKSLVFLAMFSSEMKEKTEKQLYIEDIEVGAFHELLRYIYTNSVNDLNVHAESIFKASDKYYLPNLKMICVDELTRSFKVENAVHILSLADKHNANILQRRAIKFIKSHIKLIFQTEGYKTLCRSPQAYLLSDILQALV